MRETLEVPPKYVKISGNTNGDNTLVAAVSGKKIRVLGLSLMSAGTVNLTFQSGAGGTAISGAYPLTAQAGMVLPPCALGYMETAAGALLNMRLDAGTLVVGTLTYEERY